MRRTLSLVIPMIALAAPAGARDVKLEDAVQAAIEHSPDLRMGAADREKARAEKMSALGAMGPRLSTDGGFQYWDQATSVQFLDASTLPSEAELKQTLSTLPQPMQDIFLPLVENMRNPLRVQDRLTWSVNLQVAQPLTPLYSLYGLWKANRAAEQAAAAMQDGTRETVRYRTSEAFFRILSAQRMTEVARTAVAQVEAHLKTARAFLDAGVVGRDDVLRAEAALERARDGQNQGEAGVMLARAALNVQMGLPPMEPTQPVGDYTSDPPDPGLTLEQCVEKAIRNRAEVRATSKRAEMASAGKHAAIGTMLPTLAAVFRYSHLEGSKFQREDSWFVGGTFTWTFWEWGANWYKVRSAGADVSKAQDGLRLAHDGVVLDVTKSWLDVRTARSSIQANAKAIVASEEALRVVTRKYEASTATSVEVLDAQSALTQAKAAHEVAVFNYWIARANLRRAVGVEP